MNQEKAMLRIYYTIKKKENCTFQIFYRSIYLSSIAKKKSPDRWKKIWIDPEENGLGSMERKVFRKCTWANCKIL